MVAGIRVSHPERLIYADRGVTKLDIVRYYDTVSAWMLPHVRRRPLTLLRLHLQNLGIALPDAMAAAWLSTMER